MSEELSPTAGHQRQATDKKHGNLHPRNPSAPPTVKFGLAIPPLSPLSAAQMQTPIAPESPDALELPHQYQLTQLCASGTVGPG